MPVLGEINSSRHQSDHQIDIRVDRKWKFPRWRLELYMDISNVYAHAKLIGYSCIFNYSKRVQLQQTRLTTV